MPKDDTIPVQQGWHKLLSDIFKFLSDIPALRLFLKPLSGFFEKPKKTVNILQSQFRLKGVDMIARR